VIPFDKTKSVTHVSEIRFWLMLIIRRIR